MTKPDFDPATSQDSSNDQLTAQDAAAIDAAAVSLSRGEEGSADDAEFGFSSDPTAETTSQSEDGQ
jgi:hypothetical protein